MQTKDQADITYLRRYIRGLPKETIAEIKPNDVLGKDGKTYPFHDLLLYLVGDSFSGPLPELPHKPRLLFWDEQDSKDLVTNNFPFSDFTK